MKMALLGLIYYSPRADYIYSFYKENAWVTVFRIIPEFRILRPTFHIESLPQNAELGRI